MSLQIERQDRKPESCSQEIQANWRLWARRNGYEYKDVIVIPDTDLMLELWEKPITQGWLLYQPPIPHTVSKEGVLHIIDDSTYLAFIADAAIKMVQMACVIVQMKLFAHKCRLN